jgi:assimilatory nitrate reductase catalytic subunit
MASAAVATHCPYCALQCGLTASEGPDGISVEGNAEFPVNRGGLCVKGWTAPDTLDHPERLRTPLIRDGSGRLEPASWEEALDLVARRFAELQARFGPDAIGVFGGGALTNEKAYLLGKIARVALGTSNIDYNGRFCM